VTAMELLAWCLFADLFGIRLFSQKRKKSCRRCLSVNSVVKRT
jgi:hypothetical protein